MCLKKKGLVSGDTVTDLKFIDLESELNAEGLTPFYPTQFDHSRQAVHPT